jgi:hypothetical protein
MTEPWSIAMLISGALFAAGSASIAWEPAATAACAPSLRC